MSSSFYMILDMLVAMADLGYGGPFPYILGRLRSFSQLAEMPGMCL